MTEGNIHARRRWAYKMMARCAAPPPAYGTAEWLALPEGSVEKVAAVVRAAECWATDGDNLAENLRVQAEAAARAHKDLDDAEYLARRNAHREEYRHLRLVKGTGYSQTPEFLAHGTDGLERGEPA